MIIRPGLLDRLKTISGLTDDGLAAAVGVSRNTLHRLRNGEPPSAAVIAGIARAFDLGLGEVAVIVDGEAA